MTSGIEPMRAHRSRRMRRFVAAFGSVALVGAMTLSGAPTASADTGTTLKSAMAGIGIDTLNPFLANFNGALNTFSMIYPSLTSLDATGKAAPYLATSWTTSADQLTWTFKIQDGLKWSDGQPLTAADAAWTFNLIMTNSTAGTANGSLVSNFASVTAPDATTLVIKTKKPQSNMLYVSVPQSGIPIVPQHIWESKVAGLKDFKNDSYPIVGYGPWTLTNYAVDQNETFTANKDFKMGTQGPPKYDNLILTLFKNNDAAVAALKSNQISYIRQLNPAQYNALKSDNDVTAFQELSNNWTAIEVNSGAKTRTGTAMGTGNPALEDPQVRSAINWSIDRNKLVSTVLGGLGAPGVGYLPPAYPQWAWTPPASEAVSFNLDKANSILDAAGYKKGSDGIRVDPKTGKPLELRLGIHSDNSGDTQISGFVKGWLASDGIKVDIQAMSGSLLNANLAKGDWDMLMDSWSTGPDPTYLLSIQGCDTLPTDATGTSGSTDAFYCNPAYDKLNAQQVTTFDAAARTKIVGQMQDILYNANSDLILFYQNNLDVVSKKDVSGLVTGTADGTGTFPAQTAFWNYLTATPTASASSSSSSKTGLWAGIGVVVVLLGAGGVFLMRRKSTAGDRE